MAGKSFIILFYLSNKWNRRCKKKKKKIQIICILFHPGESFKQKFLDTHNDYRRKHGAPPMIYNSQLNGEAQKWADFLLSQNTLQHSDTNDGENVYNMSSSATIKLEGPLDTRHASFLLVQICKFQFKLIFPLFAARK